MGNRAVIAPSIHTYNSKVIYLHWNGGRASVEAFLKAGKDLAIANNSNMDMSIEQLYKVIKRDFFRLNDNTNMHVYLRTWDTADRDNWDNGTYLIDEAFNIVGRKGERTYGEEINAEKTKGIYEQIMASAPIYNS
jgi:hypothetical protein